MVRQRISSWKGEEQDAVCESGAGEGGRKRPEGWKSSGDIYMMDRVKY